MVKGYDLFGDHGRNLPTPHGSGTRPMYADMGKSCRPDPNRKIEYPHVVALFTLDSHNTSYFFKREWQLTDDVEIKEVVFEDGLLSINLGKVVPEHHARKDYL